MKNNNGKQNERMAVSETKIDNLKDKVNHFIDNDFCHFKKSVDNKFSWLTLLVVTGILVPILLFVIK